MDVSKIKREYIDIEGSEVGEFEREEAEALKDFGYERRREKFYDQHLG